MMLSFRLLLCFARPVGIYALLITLGLVACGPTAPSPTDDPAGLTASPTISPEDAPTVPTPDDDLTLPPGWPTEEPFIAYVPTNTPWPTLAPEPPGVAEEEARHRATMAAIAQTPDPPLAAQVKQQASDFSQGYPDDGAIVRAEITAHRVVEPNLDITWPDRLFSPPYYTKLENEDEYAAWRRSELKINESYHNTLPQGYEIIAPEFAPNEALEVGNEYILYVVRYHVAKDELPEVNKIQRFNDEQLAALGGSGGLAWLDTNWVIDGDRAWRIAEDHMATAITFTPVLEAAKANGESLPLADLEAAIRAGVGN